MLVWLGLGAGAVLVLFVGYLFVWSPLEDTWRRQAEADKELSEALEKLSVQKKTNDRLLKVSPRLKVAEKLSLPPSAPPVKGKPALFRPLDDQKAAHVAVLGHEYRNYLLGLLINAGFEKPEVTARPSQKQANNDKKKAAPVFEPLVFTVTARGTQRALYKALQDFHSTNLLHEIRNLTAEVAKPKSREKPDPNVLTVNMTVEALILRNGKTRTTLLPAELKEQPDVLASARRDYSLLEKRSIFTGLMPPPPPPSTQKKEEKKPPPEPEPDPELTLSDRLEVLEFVKVTMVAYNPKMRRWEASLYDQAQGKSDEIKVTERGAFRSFTIYNEDEREVLEARVKFIGWPSRVGDPDNAPTREAVLIFEADKKFYVARVGDFLDTVYRKPLSDKEAIELGLLKPKK
jgi:hypothetical protein